MEDGLSVGDVESIQCFVPVEEVPIICEPWERKLQPISGYEAKFSLPYCLASLLVDHTLNVATFERGLPDEKVLSVAKKISFKPLFGAGFPERFSGSLEVLLTSGQILSASVADVRGSQNRLLSSEEIRRKFTLNARRRLTADTVAIIMAEFDLLEDAPNIKPLSKALRSVASKPR
jgi:2-methylcitrate dehydratase PrpD